MKKILLKLVTVFIIYFVIIQPVITLLFMKGEDSETVLLKVTKQTKGEFDLGLMSDYKYKYDVEVYKRDGWVGYIDKVFSNKKLTPNRTYGLELHMVECSSWFDFFLVPSLWSHYNFDISDIYNNNKALKKFDFQTEDHDKLYEAMEKDYSMWDYRSGN